MEEEEGKMGTLVWRQSSILGINLQKLKGSGSGTEIHRMFTINCLLMVSVKVSEYCVFLDVIVFDGCLIKRVKVMFVRS
jgi:hypothetical protein